LVAPSTIIGTARRTGLDKSKSCTKGHLRRHVRTRRQLLTVSRGINAHITERTVDVHVLNLRKKIEADPSSPVHLLTVYKVGYKPNDRTPAGTSLPSDSW
jgi:hypothetical protein